MSLFTQNIRSLGLIFCWCRKRGAKMLSQPFCGAVLAAKQLGSLLWCKLISLNRLKYWLNGLNLQFPRVGLQGKQAYIWPNRYSLKQHVKIFSEMNLERILCLHLQGTVVVSMLVIGMYVQSSCTIDLFDLIYFLLPLSRNKSQRKEKTRISAGTFKRPDILLGSSRL